MLQFRLKIGDKYTIVFKIIKKISTAKSKDFHVLMSTNDLLCITKIDNSYNKYYVEDDKLYEKNKYVG